MRWDDVNARARGLATHLLDQRRRSQLDQARTWEQLATLAREAGYPVDPHLPGSPEQFDHVVGEVAAGRFALLGRWLGPRRAVLQVVYEAEERQALRTLLRGAVQGVSPEIRLRSITPTPGMPRAMLEDLARVDAPAALAAALLRHGHPAGRALETAVGDPHPPGLLGMELALARTFAARATRAARKGGRILRAFAAWTVDLENAWTLLQAPAWGTDSPGTDAFLGGGRVLSVDRFTTLAARDADAIAAGLSETFGGTPFAGVFAQNGDGPGLERRVLGAQMAWCKAIARIQPLGPAVVLGILLAIQAEAHDFRAAAWALTLEAPAATGATSRA